MKKIAFLSAALIVSVGIYSFTTADTPTSTPTPVSNSVSETDIQWMTVEEAVAAAAKEPRPIMMDIYTNWCGPCQMMSKNTFHNADFVNYMNANYYCVKFNAESPDTVRFKEFTFANPDFNPQMKGRNGVHQFARYLQVSAYPTLCFFDSNADYLGPVVGYKTASQLEIFVKFFRDEQYKTITTSEQWQAHQAAFVPSWKD